jgi:predicted DNA-binding transcriptional regulator AlpA
MAQRHESKAAAARRARSEFDSYADTVLLTEPEAAAVSGFSSHTYKFWRLKKSTKGPQPVYLHGMVRYEVREIRRWRACNTAPENEGPHALRLMTTREIEAV